MPASPPTAYALLKAFGLLEYHLKLVPEFTGIGPRQSAKVDWQAVDQAVERMAAADFFDRVSQPTKNKLLGGARDRPKVQLVQVVGGRNTVHFQTRPLHLADGRALVEA